MKTWRLLPLETRDGSGNMAVDEALLRLHAEGRSPATVRFYQWAPAAISLGRSQGIDALDREACRRQGLAVVRRSTGGRAVLHGDDLTYSVVAGTADGVPATPADSYLWLCAGLAAGLRLLGVAAEQGREPARAVGPAACFLRSVAGDLTHRGRKFLGSAQRWRRGSLLQHGSLLLAPQTEAWADLLGSVDPVAVRAGLAASTTSIREILGRTVPAPEVARALARGFEIALGVRLEPGGLNSEEKELAARIAVEEFPAR